MRRMTKWVVSAISVGLMSAAAVAAPPPTPTQVSGFRIVTVEEARSLLGKATFLDMRSAMSYGKGHIRSAKAVPYEGKSENTEAFDSSKDRFDVATLPADKGAPLVFYSDGPTGWKSYKAAVLAARAGYRNVAWMREGTSGWVAKGLPLE